MVHPLKYLQLHHTQLLNYQWDCSYKYKFLNIYQSCNLYHCVQSVQIRSYFWSYFPVFRLNTEICSVKISVFSPNTGKYGPEITLYLDIFHSVYDTHKHICWDSKHITLCIHTVYFFFLHLHWHLSLFQFCLELHFLL